MLAAFPAESADGGSGDPAAAPYLAAPLISGFPDGYGPAAGDHRIDWKEREMRIDEVMTGRVVAVPPDLPLKHLARLLLANDISGAPVVDGGCVVGVVSEGDVVRLEQGPSPPSAWTMILGRSRDLRREWLTVADAMTSPAITIEPWESVAAGAATMVANNVNRLPVVHGGRLVGIVARADLLRAFARSDEEIEREIEEEVFPALVPEGDVDVRVHHGEVELDLTHQPGADGDALARDVRRVAGVVGVRVEGSSDT